MWCVVGLVNDNDAYVTLDFGFVTIWNLLCLLAVWGFVCSGSDLFVTDCTVVKVVHSDSSDVSSCLMSLLGSVVNRCSVNACGGCSARSAIDVVVGACSW